jgi:U3 small nucleolar RNA-associated protein 15
VYNPVTKLVVKNLSRFRENAYGAVFRSDGRLLCTGSEETNVKLFDISSKNLLRLFKGHSAAVHRTFFLEGKPYIASFSDDKSVKIWDMPTEKNIISYSEHTDYVRAGATNPAIPDVVLSGGYDNSVKMYDTRINEMILNVDHGSPVESLLFLPAGSIFISAGGTEIKIWDTRAGNKLLTSVSHHHKTITCLALASDNSRLMSGSLDMHVKIYDLNNFEVVHNFEYSNSVISLAVSKNDETVAAGLVDGLVVINRRGQKEKKSEEKESSFKHTINLCQSTIDMVVPQYVHDKETKYDKCLRKFEYSKALNCVLVNYIANRTPQVTVSVIQELIRRRALQKAFDQRDLRSIKQILQFFIRNITEAPFTKVLIDAANVFIDVYENNPIMMNPEVTKLLISLTKLLREEAELANKLTELQGIMHMLLTAATAHTKPTLKCGASHNLTPSANAQENFTVNIT